MKQASAQFEPAVAPSELETEWDVQIDQPRLVYVIDDDPDLRESLHFALSTSSIRARSFAAPEEFLDRLETLKPAPILLDLRMPTLDGFQVLEALLDRKVEWPVIMMSAHGDIPAAVTAMKRGAIDFIEKPFHLDKLDRLLEKSFAMLSATAARTAKRAEARRMLEKLTPRESETVGWLVQGLSNKDVARRLGLSPRTVEIHRANALAKLGAKSLAEAVRIELVAQQGADDKQ